VGGGGGGRQLGCWGAAGRKGLVSPSGAAAGCLICSGGEIWSRSENEEGSAKVAAAHGQVCLRGDKKKNNIHDNDNDDNNHDERGRNIQEKKTKRRKRRKKKRKWTTRTLQPLRVLVSACHSWPAPSTPRRGLCARGRRAVLLL